MGLYDNFQIPSSGQYVSTYAGQPIQEVAALGDSLNKAYDRGFEGVTAFNAMQNNVQVDDADMALKDKLFDDVSTGLKKYAERGDYENASHTVLSAVSNIARNKDLKKAKASYIEKVKHQETLEKMFNSRKINADQYKYAMGRLNEYEGISSGDSMSKHMYIPAEAVNVQDMLMKIGKNVAVQEKSYYIDDPSTGKQIKRTETAVDQKELDYVLRNALQNDPKIAAYHEDLANMYGPVQAKAMMEQQLAGAFAAVDSGIKYDDQYISKDHKALGTGNNIGGDSSSSGYQYVDVQNTGKHAVDYTDMTDSGYNLGEIDQLMDKLKIAGMIEEGKEDSWLGDIETSIDKFLNNANVSQEDLTKFNKYKTATKDYYKISDEEWDSKSNEEKTQIGKNYLQEQGKTKQQLGYRQLNVNDAKASGLVGKTANPDDQAMLNGAADYIKTNKNSITFYDIESGEQVSIGQSNDLQNALSEKAGTGGIRVMGETDYKNPYAVNNPALADSYYFTAYDKDGNEKTFLATKPDKHYKNPSRVMANSQMNVSNGDYSGMVANISNTFKMTAFPESIDYGQASVNGAKHGKNQIALSSIDVKGGPIDLKRFSDANDLPMKDGKLIISYDNLAKFMFLWNKPQPKK